MQTKTFMDRLRLVGLVEVGVIARARGRTLVLESDAGEEFYIDHPDDYTAAQRIGLLNRFMAHHGFDNAIH